MGRLSIHGYARLPALIMFLSVLFLLLCLVVTEVLPLLSLFNHNRSRMRRLDDYARGWGRNRYTGLHVYIDVYGCKSDGVETKTEKGNQNI